MSAAACEAQAPDVDGDDAGVAAGIGLPQRVEDERGVEYVVSVFHEKFADTQFL